ncbi:MAG: FecR family protein [Spirochaetota bacterium]
MKKIPILILLLFLCSCKKKQEPTVTNDPSLNQKKLVGVVMFSSGDTNISSPTARKLQQYDKLYENDRIQVGSKSSIDLYLNTKISVRLKENTDISIQKNGSDFSVRLYKGEVLSLVRKKLAKEEAYKVNLGNHIASVRGTSFSVSKKDIEEAKVEEGVIVLEPFIPSEIEKKNTEQPAKSKQEIVVEEGKKTTIPEDTTEAKIEPMPAPEKQQLKKDFSALSQIMETHEAEVLGIFETFEKEKQRIKQTLEEQKKINEEVLEEQKKKNKDLVEKQKEGDAKLLNEQKQKNKETLNSVTDQSDTQKKEVQKTDKNSILDKAKQDLQNIQP